MAENFVGQYFRRFYPCLMHIVSTSSKNMRLLLSCGCLLKLSFEEGPSLNDDYAMKRERACVHVDACGSLEGMNDILVYVTAL